MSASVPTRVPEKVAREAKQVAALHGKQPGEFLGEAWDEYLANHREQFAADLAEAAELMRDGTLDQLATFANRGAEGRAERAAVRLRGEDS